MERANRESDAVTLAFIADAHLKNRESDVAPFLEHLASLRSENITELILLGDIFHYYVGFPSWAKFYPEEIFASLQKVRESGIRITYIEGNRDFFLDGSLLSSSISRIVNGVDIGLGRVKLHAEHGDLVNRKDRRYRFWRRLSKSLLIRFLLRVTPPGVIKPFVDGTERGLKRTNKAHRRRLPIEEFQAFAARHGDADLLVLGHFHERFTERYDGRNLIILPAWMDEHTALLVDREGRTRWQTLS